MRKVFLMKLFMLTIFITGCWDQNLLVNKKFINGVSFDLTEEDKILAAVRTLDIRNKGGGQFDIKDKIVQSTQPTVVGTRIDINNKIPGQLDISKAYIILIGEELAKKGIHPILEPFYRPKDSYIAARIVITKGDAFDILSKEPKSSPIAFDILQSFEEAEKSTIIPKETVFTTWAQIVDSGGDVIIPLVEAADSNKVSIGGMALFNGDKFSGTSLSTERSTLLLLLMDKLEKISPMALILDQDRSLSFQTTSLKRDFNLKINKPSGKIICKVNLKINIQITSYPQNFNKKINLDKLNKDLSVKLTKQAKEVTNILLEANCDAFGIGRELASAHPELWKRINWEEEYKKVQFEPKVKVNIITTGHVF
ncbi:hypothetical protein COM24_14965 [Bacillus toyonensis]|uniref:Ger(x)C family spore germination protein n=1 Tax=Bacillus toyonensis TaxID=155322 RepID=UPI000BF51304|nr:Ger(x)C family spore germination protein [Bacillus toyonensis]PGC53276.1 hypothetical protein COM24_14965 [Bacillus toyonensis]